MGASLLVNPGTKYGVKFQGACTGYLSPCNRVLCGFHWRGFMTVIFKSKLGDLLMPGVLHALTVLATAKGALGIAWAF